MCRCTLCSDTLSWWATDRHLAASTVRRQEPAGELCNVDTSLPSWGYEAGVRPIVAGHRGVNERAVSAKTISAAHHNRRRGIRAQTLRSYPAAEGWNANSRKSQR